MILYLHQYRRSCPEVKSKFSISALALFKPLDPRATRTSRGCARYPTRTSKAASSFRTAVIYAHVTNCYYPSRRPPIGLCGGRLLQIRALRRQMRQFSSLQVSTSILHDNGIHGMGPSGPLHAATILRGLDRHNL
jgi:hypothetical protein